MNNDILLSMKVGQLINFWELKPGSFFFRKGKYLLKTSYTRYFEIGSQHEEGTAHRPVTIGDEMGDCYSLDIRYTLGTDNALVSTEAERIV